MKIFYTLLMYYVRNKYWTPCQHIILSTNQLGWPKSNRLMDGNICYVFYGVPGVTSSWWNLDRYDIHTGDGVLSFPHLIPDPTLVSWSNYFYWERACVLLTVVRCLKKSWCTKMFEKCCWFKWWWCFLIFLRSNFLCKHVQNKKVLESAAPQDLHIQ